MITTALLGDITSINPRAQSVAFDEPVSFVGMAELDAKTAIARPLETRLFGVVSKGYTVFRNRDVLVAKITPCWENGKVGQAQLEHRIGVGSTEFHVVRPGPLVDERYVLHFLRQQSIRAAGTLRMTGSGGQRRVPVAFLQNLSIPLPALDEQRRIAAILDRAAALLAKRRPVLAHLGTLVQSIFHDMFGEVGGSRWTKVALGDIVGEIDNGRSPNCEARPAEPNEWGVLKLGAVTYGIFQAGENKAYLGKVGSMASKEVRVGDVLMTRKNTRELVGAVALVENVRPRLLLPDLIFRLQLDLGRIDPRYFQALMMNSGKRPAVRDLSSGSAASMPNISKARLMNLSIELPPLDLQREFAGKVEKVNAQRAAAQRVLATDNELFASLQYRAFKGEF